MGFLLAKTFARGGYYVFADQDYESRVRGGHNFFRVRISDKEIGAITEKVDMLMTLNRESIDLYHAKLRAGGMVIYDSEIIKDTDNADTLLSVPLEKLAEQKAGSRIRHNLPPRATRLRRSTTGTSQRLAVIPRDYP